MLSSKQQQLNQTNKLRTKRRLSQLEFKTLEDVWLCIFICIIQVICIYRACLNFNKFNGIEWTPFERPTIELWLYLFFIGLSIILLPVLVFTSLIKIGSYANDNYEFGKDLDYKELANKSQKSISKTQNQLIDIQKKKALTNRANSHYSLMANNDLNDPKNISKRSSQPFSTSSIISSSIYSDSNKCQQGFYTGKFKPFMYILRSMFSVKRIWKNSMPVASLVHLIISFILMFPNVLLISKEIEYDLRPKGFIHHSQMDFLFMRPLDRFSESKSFLDPSPLYFDLKTNDPANRVNYYMSKNQIKLQLISSSLKDLDQINYSPHISIEFFNYILALVIFSFRYSGTLWNLNKLYAFVFSVHLMLVGLISLVSFASFEILYKFQSCFSKGIKLKLDLEKQSDLHNTTTNSTLHYSNFNSVVFNLPFATGPISLQIFFFFSMILFLLSSVPIYAYGIYQYKIKLKKLRYQLTRFIPTTNISNKVVNSYTDESKVYLNGSTADSSSASSDHNVYTSNNIDTSTMEPNLSMTAANEPLLIQSNYSSPPPLPSQPPPVPQTQNKKYKKSKPILGSSSECSLSLENSTMSLTKKKNLKQVDLFHIQRTPLFLIYAPYKNHIFALLILLAICLNSAVIIYDYICLYQLTSDTISFWSAILSIVFILWYICLWLILTFKTEWSFEFSPLFKLNYWHISNKIACLNKLHANSLCNTTFSSTETFKRNKSISSRLPTNNHNLMTTSYTAGADLNVYEFASRNQHYIHRHSDKRAQPGFKTNTSLSLSNLTNNYEGVHRQNNNNQSRGGNHTSVFSSSGLLVSDNAQNHMLSNYHATPASAHYQGDYDASADVTPYENFNTMSDKNNKTNGNLGKKQPSLRRINQLIMTEQRLAPVFENTTINSENKSNTTENNLNHQLYLLRKSMNKNEKEQTYDTAASAYELDNQEQVNTESNSGNSGKSTESIYNLKEKSKASLNYTSINELEKRASAIITNSKSVNKINQGGDQQSKQLTVPKVNTIMPLHLNQQAAETSPKSQSSTNSDTSHPTSNTSNLQDSDSGRHSMSESPPTTTTIATTNFFQPTSNQNKQNSAGTFTSKCILSTGTVTMSQTMQKLQQQRRQQSAKPEGEYIIKKKCRSTSREQLKEQIRDQIREQQRDTVMTKSSSFCKGALPPTSNQITSRSNSIDRRINSNNNITNTNSSANNLAANYKRSNSSINRNCSDL